MCEKEPTGSCCDKVIRIQRGNHADTREFLDKAVQNWNKTAKSSDSLDCWERGFGEKCGRLVSLCGLRWFACLVSQARYHVECLQAIPIKITLVLGEWLHNVHDLVVIQLHAVPVACGSNWILRSISSAIAFRLFRCLCLEEVIYFIFPSLSRSSHWSACLVSDAEAGVPFCCLLCPSLIW